MSEGYYPPLKLEAESVDLKSLDNEWEICINLSNGESLYHYTQYPDGIVDQLNMDIDVEPVKMGDNTNQWCCPVCDKTFDYSAEADRHYDAHKPSEYIIEWEEEV